jgi:Fe-S cluster biogenesis protein NfuA
MSESKIAPFSIYAESTPNPNTMKFVANRPIMENNATIEFTDPDQTGESPLAAAIFNFPFVTNLFFAANFVTVSKNDLIEWDDVSLELRDFIQGKLNGLDSFFNQEIKANSNLSANAEKSDFVEIKAGTPIEEKIVSVLEEYITPAVAGDGGAINFKSFKDGVVTVIMRGACSGCPSSTVTLKQGVETLMKQMVPEVTEVVTENY